MHEDGGGARAKSREQPLEAGKVKETDSPLTLADEMQPCRHRDFSPVKPILDFRFLDL